MTQYGNPKYIERVETRRSVGRRAAAAVAGGGGGGRDTMAQAGGRNPDKLDDALSAAREAIERSFT